MNNKTRYIVIQGNDVIAHILENQKYGLVVVFLSDKVSVLHDMQIYDLDKQGYTEHIDILDIIRSAFPVETKKD